MGRMKREGKVYYSSFSLPKKVFLVIFCCVLVVDTVIVAMMWNVDFNAEWPFWVVAGPGFPISFLLAQVFPPPMGEDNVTDWDYMMLTVCVLSSSFMCATAAWGVARLIYRLRGIRFRVPVHPGWDSKEDQRDLKRKSDFDSSYKSWRHFR